MLLAFKSPTVSVPRLDVTVANGMGACALSA